MQKVGNFSYNNVKHIICATIIIIFYITYYAFQWPRALQKHFSNEKMFVQFCVSLFAKFTVMIKKRLNLSCCFVPGVFNFICKLKRSKMDSFFARQSEINYFFSKDFFNKCFQNQDLLAKDFLVLQNHFFWLNLFLR